MGLVKTIRARDKELWKFELNTFLLSYSAPVRVVLCSFTGALVIYVKLYCLGWITLGKYCGKFKF